MLLLRGSAGQEQRDSEPPPSFPERARGWNTHDDAVTRTDAVVWLVRSVRVSRLRPVPNERVMWGRRLRGARERSTLQLTAHDDRDAIGRVAPPEAL